jgi:hypothetical protein
LPQKRPSPLSFLSQQRPPKTLEDARPLAEVQVVGQGLEPCNCPVIFGVVLCLAVVVRDFEWQCAKSGKRPEETVSARSS